MTDLDYEPRRWDEVRRAKRQFGWILLATGLAAPVVAMGLASAINGIALAMSSGPGGPDIGVSCMGLVCVYASLFYSLVAIIYGISFLVRNRK